MKKKFLFVLVGLVVALGAVAGQLLFGKNSLRQQRKISQDIDLFQQKIDSLQNVILNNDSVIQNLKNDSLYKVGILRTRYGMSEKGERVFQYQRSEKR